MAQRKRHTGQFKARVAVEAIAGVQNDAITSNARHAVARKMLTAMLFKHGIGATITVKLAAKRRMPSKQKNQGARKNTS